MTEQNRRRFLRTAGTAGFAAVAGCLDGGQTDQDNTPTSTGTQNGTETATPTEDTSIQRIFSSDSLSAGSLAELVTNPAEMYEAGATHEGRGETVDGSYIVFAHPKATYGALSAEMQRNADNKLNGDFISLDRAMVDRDFQDVEAVAKSKSGVSVNIYDDSISEGDLLEALESHENVQRYDGDINSYGLPLFKAEDVEDVGKNADGLMAVEGNTTVTAHELDYESSEEFEVIKDMAAAMQVALNTFKGDNEGYLESGPGSDIFESMVDYAENGDLWELDGAQRYRIDVAPGGGAMKVTRYQGDTQYSGDIHFDQTGEPTSLDEAKNPEEFPAFDIQPL